MTDLIGLILGFFEDLRFWKKNKKKKPNEKKTVLEFPAKLFIIALIIIILLKLYGFLF